MEFLDHGEEPEFPADLVPFQQPSGMECRHVAVGGRIGDSVGRLMRLDGEDIVGSAESPAQQSDLAMFEPRLAA